MVCEEKKWVMDDFGNIIYVLAAIGWFFWNAYKKTQQGKESRVPAPEAGRSEPTSTETESGDPFRSFEEMILEQLEGKKKPAPTTNVPSSDEVVRNAKAEQAQASTGYQMSVSEIKNHRAQRQKERKEKEVVQDESTLMESLFQDEGFDLKKAIVLNAILDRPYR